MSEFLTTTPRRVYCQLNKLSDGSAVTSAVTVSVVLDGAVAVAGLGTLEHQSGGHWQYLPHATEAAVTECSVQFNHAEAQSVVVTFYPTPQRLREIAAALAALNTDIQAVATGVVAILQAFDELPENLLTLPAGVETNLTLREFLRLTTAVLIGKASGLATNTAVFRDFNDTKPRVTATVDENGNRTSIIYDKT